MDNQHDFTLRVQNSDITKAVSRWMHEGMGITNENILEYLQEAVSSNVKKYLESSITKKSIENIVMDYIVSYFQRINLNINGRRINTITDMVEVMISQEVKACVDKTVRKITDEYLTITYKPKSPEDEA